MNIRRYFVSRRGLRAGTGLFARLVSDKSGPQLLFYNRTTGALRLASGTDWKVVTVAGGDGMVHVLLGNAEGSLAAGLDIAVGQDPQDIAAADLNGDGLLDLVTANVASGGVSVILTGA